MRRYFLRFANQLHYKENDMSSGKYRRHDGHNPIQIKDGNVVRLRKNGTVKNIIGTLADIKRSKKK